MARNKTPEIWLLGIKKNNKTYYASGFDDENDLVATWVANVRHALKFDNSPYAVEFKNTFFSNRSEVFPIKLSR